MSDDREKGNYLRPFFPSFMIAHSRACLIEMYWVYDSSAEELHQQEVQIVGFDTPCRNNAQEEQ